MKASALVSHRIQPLILSSHLPTSNWTKLQTKLSSIGYESTAIQLAEKTLEENISYQRKFATGFPPIFITLGTDEESNVRY